MGALHLEQASLSDGLAALIRQIEPTRKTGLVVIRRDVGPLLDGLQAMLDQARHLETIADREQWNRKALRDAQLARRASLEDAIAEGVVELFPVAPRASAMPPEGGAA